MAREVALKDLTLDEMRSEHEVIDQSVYDVLGPENAVAAMQSDGSTGPDQVRQQVKRWEERLQ
jgi:argininosuccinate lyase